MRSVFLAICLIAALGWTWATPQPQQTMQTEPAANQTSSDTKALVHIYRYKEEGSGGLPVFCDETELAKLDNGRYFLAKLNAGRHVFHSSDKQSGIELDLKSGQEYYIRVAMPPPLPGVFRPKGRVVLVAPEQGTYEVQKLRPIDSRKIKNTEMVSPPEPVKP